MTGRISLALMCALSAGSLAAGDMVSRRVGTPPRPGAAGAPKVDKTQPNSKAPAAYVPEAKTAPKIDGTLDDEAWSKAAILPITRTLDGMNKAAVPTEVRLLRDAANLYVGVKATEPMMNKLVGSARGKDGEVWADDSIEIFIGVKNGGAYFHFGVNAFGSLYDGQVKDAAWDSAAKVAAAKGKDFWTVTLAIPLEKMTGKGKAPAEWIANFNRNRYAGGSLEEFAWSPTFSGNSHEPEMFGNVIFGEPPAEPRPAAPEVKQPEKPVAAGGVEITPAEGGEGVARFNLSFLPKDARIYRADLLVYRTVAVDGQLEEARIDIEMYPLFAAPAAGQEPRPDGKPLAPRAPWFDRFDATEAVRQWASGKTNGGLYVKALPFWDRPSTCLDVYYEGKADNPPQQATEVKAFHNAGQTFITFKEIADPVNADDIAWGPLKMILDDVEKQQVRYCVLRSDKPITPATVAQAEMIAQVRPLSCWNVNGRNIERAIDIAIATKDWINCGQWNPFGSASADGDYGRDCPIDRLVIRDGDKPLPRGTGLYVHSPTGAGKAYYAVLTSVAGVINAGDISEKNAPSQAVDEAPGEGEPVLQRELPKMPFFNFPDRRLHYVAWVAPPYGNLPSQYYNWSVGVPNELGRTGVSPVQPGRTGVSPVQPGRTGVSPVQSEDTGGTPVLPVPLELSLPRDGDSYWRTQYRLERDSIVVAPHDFPFRTWWYGYHESYGTLKSFAGGVVQPYTERRLLAFIRWASRKWPVDPNKIIATGCRGGTAGGGALHIGLRHPEVFALVVAGHGDPDYAPTAAAPPRDRNPNWVAQSTQAVWGRLDWKLKTDTGKCVWDEHDMVRLVTEAKPASDLPLVTMTSSENHLRTRQFYQAMLENRRPLISSFSWGGTRYIPVSATGTYPNVIRQDIRLDKPMLAFSYAKAMEFCTKGGMGDINNGIRWGDVQDELDLFEVGIAGNPGGGVDVTLRRPQKFKPQAGKTYAYVNTGPGKPERGSAQAVIEKQEGEVVVDADGVLTIKNLKIYPANGRLVVMVKYN